MGGGFPYDQTPHFNMRPESWQFRPDGQPLVFPFDRYPVTEKTYLPELSPFWSQLFSSAALRPSEKNGHAGMPSTQSQQDKKESAKVSRPRRSATDNPHAKQAPAFERKAADDIKQARPPEAEPVVLREGVTASRVPFPEQSQMKEGGDTLPEVPSKRGEGATVSPSKFEGSSLLSPSLAASRVQAHFRGYLTRKSEPLKHLRVVAKVQSELSQLVKSEMASSDAIDKVASTPHEKLRMNEKLMALLLQLDTVQCMDAVVRRFRKDLAREIVKLMDTLDERALQLQDRAGEAEVLCKVEVEPEEDQQGSASGQQSETTAEKAEISFAAESKPGDATLQGAAEACSGGAGQLEADQAKQDGGMESSLPDTFLQAMKAIAEGAQAEATKMPNVEDRVASSVKPVVIVEVTEDGNRHRTQDSQPDQVKKPANSSRAEEEGVKVGAVGGAVGDENHGASSANKEETKQEEARDATNAAVKPIIIEVQSPSTSSGSSPRASATAASERDWFRQLAEFLPLTLQGRDHPADVDSPANQSRALRPASRDAASSEGQRQPETFGMLQQLMIQNRYLKALLEKQGESRRQQTDLIAHQAAMVERLQARVQLLEEALIGRNNPNFLASAHPLVAANRDPVLFGFDDESQAAIQTADQDGSESPVLSIPLHKLLGVPPMMDEKRSPQEGLALQPKVGKKMAGLIPELLVVPKGGKKRSAMEMPAAMVVQQPGLSAPEVGSKGIIDPQARKKGIVRLTPEVVHAPQDGRTVIGLTPEQWHKLAPYLVSNSRPYSL